MFYVFTGMQYYPSGGWGDFIGTADTLDAARAHAETAADGSDDWYQIVDASSLKVVEEGGLEDSTTYDPYEEKHRAVPSSPGNAYRGI